MIPRLRGWPTALSVLLTLGCGDGPGLREPHFLGRGSAVDDTASASLDTPGPAAALNAAGDALVAWEQQRAQGSVVWASRFRSGEGWRAPESLATADRSPGLRAAPQVALAPDGRGVVVWRQETGGRGTLWSRRFNPPSGWQPAQPVPTGEGADVSGHHLSFSENGRTLLLWHTRDELFAQMGTPEGWEPAARVSSGGVVFQGALNAGGAAVAAWVVTSFPGPRPSQALLAARHTPGLGWAAPETLTGGWSVSTSRLGLDEAANAMLLLQVTVGAPLGVAFDRSGPDGRWSGEGLSGPAYPFQLAMSPAGEAVALIAVTTTTGEQTAPTPRLWASRFRPDAGWGPLERLPGNPTDGVSSADVAMLPAGAQAVWTRDQEIWTSRLAASGWSVPETVRPRGMAGTDCLEGRGPFVDGLTAAGNNRGDVMAIWAEFDCSLWTVWARSLGSSGG